MNKVKLLETIVKDMEICIGDSVGEHVRKQAAAIAVLANIIKSMLSEVKPK